MENPATIASAPASSASTAMASTGAEDQSSAPPTGGASSPSTYVGISRLTERHEVTIGSRIAVAALWTGGFRLMDVSKVPKKVRDAFGEREIYFYSGDIDGRWAVLIISADYHYFGMIMRGTETLTPSEIDSDIQNVLIHAPGEFPSAAKELSKSFNQLTAWANGKLK